MGYLSDFIKGWDAGRTADYEQAVHHILRTEFGLDWDRQWRLKSFDEHIGLNKAKCVPAQETAIEVAVAYYVAQCMGDAQDREDANFLYMSLKPAIQIAGLSGAISSSRAEELLGVVSNYTQQSVFRDMEEGTGMFSSISD